MGRKCCVVKCKGNYDDQTKVKVYKLPRNLEERKRWLTITPRDNVPDTKETVVYEKHWLENYPAKLDYGRERPRDHALTQPSSNITTTKKKYRQGIRRSKEFIT